MFYRDYTGKAIFTFFLYFCGYVPGLVVNFLLLLEALEDREWYGYVPGLGCLIGLLLVCGVGPIAALIFVYVGLQHLY